MLGFEALSDGGEPRARDGELEEVRWFPPRGGGDAMDGRNPRLLLPPPHLDRPLPDRALGRKDRLSASFSPNRARPAAPGPR